MHIFFLASQSSMGGVGGMTNHVNTPNLKLSWAVSISNLVKRYYRHSNSCHILNMEITITFMYPSFLNFLKLTFFITLFCVHSFIRVCFIFVRLFHFVIVCLRVFVFNLMFVIIFILDCVCYCV